MSVERSPEEEMFDKVASYLYKGTLNDVRKEFSLHLFAEWSKTNLDIILKAITKSNQKVRTKD
ncbi:MAG: hypothetical protein JSW11_16590 [Candidatus Heimdallarchaeota archaeon]|nr:MAG: hypothetical protein JSW11_16590 [Candidatus Heimdallarchaeota archaeon]